jgi:hypothetical protein
LYGKTVSMNIFIRGPYTTCKLIFFLVATEVSRFENCELISKTIICFIKDLNQSFLDIAFEPIPVVRLWI